MSFWEPGSPLPDGSPEEATEFDRMLGLTPEQSDHWVWGALTGLLEAPTIPRGLSEWTWHCVYVLGAAEFLRILEGVLPNVPEGTAFEIAPRDIILPLAEAFPDREVAYRRLVDIVHVVGAPVQDEHRALVDDIYAMRDVLLRPLRRREGPFWIVPRRVSPS